MKRISLNKVMAKLAEQPEKVEKVELRDIVGELNSLSKELKKHKSNAVTKSNEIINDIKRLYNHLVDLKESADALEAKAEYAVEGFAEVGMQPPREVSFAISDSTRAKKGALGGLKTAQTAIKNIQKISGNL